MVTNLSFVSNTVKGIQTISKRFSLRYSSRNTQYTRPSKKYGVTNSN